jgi:hypothetical protein
MSSFLPPFRPGSLVMPAYAPDYVAKLKRQKDAIERLCTAARDFLCADIDETLERIEHPPQFTPPIIKPDMESLVRAQHERDQIQAQIDALENLCAEVPDVQAEYFRTMQLPGLEESLKRADEWLTTIQKAMESEPDFPAANTEPKP